MNGIINEELARRAKEMNSFRTYKEGSETAEYNRLIEEAEKLAARQKNRVDALHHERIERYLERYKIKLAEHINRGNEIETRCPSIMISGRSNFPIRQKEKQNAARDKHMKNNVQGLLDKIRGCGMAGVSGDDAQARGKLEEKLAKYKASHEKMKEVNAYYRKHQTLDGCALITQEERERLQSYMARGITHIPYSSLSNSSAEIRRLENRLEELAALSKAATGEERFPGGVYRVNRELNRVQFIFDEKPGEETRGVMKSSGFRWAPSRNAWQRQATLNGIRDARRVFKKLSAAA